MKLSTVTKVLIALFAMAVLSYVVYMAWESSDSDNSIICTSLEVDMKDDAKIKLISEIEIAKILEAKGINPVSQKYSAISTESIERELLKNKMIRTVQCYKTTSGKVIVDVTQRIPKFLIVGNESYYVDSDRKLMPVSLNYAAYVPVVSGRVIKSMATRQIFDFVNYLEKDTFWNAQIEQIYIREDLSVELIPRVGNAVIILGRFDNFEKKLRNLQQLYLQAFNVIGWNRYDKIDLQFQGQIVCTKTGTKPIIIKRDTVVVNDSIAIKKK
ncbi:MAG: cell division protein FtsQ/DivIB [Paludibacter sp.]